MKRINKYIFILLTLFVASVADAQRVKGYDALGLAKFCDVYLQAPKLPAVSTLLNTFGDPMPCIEKRIKQGGLQTVQVDLIDATCWRNNKCPNGVPKPTDLSAITKRARKVNRYAVNHPSVEWWISPALEHDEKNQNTVKAMMEAAKRGCPVCKIINSPFSGARISGYPLELHGTKIEAFAVSGDGASSFDADNLDSNDDPKKSFNHSKSGSDQTYLWWNELNLRCTGEKTFTPPLSRIEKPTLQQFKHAYLISKNEEPKPKAPGFCKKVSEIKEPQIYKPNAESYCNGVPKDNRSNKPLLIIPMNGRHTQKLKVYSPSGKEVGCFKYYGVFQGNLHRWYMGDCSGQTASELFENFGGEWGFVKTGSDNCILINSVRRLGVMR